MFFGYNNKEEAEKHWSLKEKPSYTKVTQICTKTGCVGFLNGVFSYSDGTQDTGKRHQLIFHKTNGDTISYGEDVD